MKRETKLKKQLESVDEWLLKARELLQMEFISKQSSGAFYLLIGVECLVQYIKAKESQ